jgi:TrmH family RNA methyltransferase
MITSPDNPKVKLARLLREPKGRHEQGCCLVEGVRLIEEAMRAGHSPALIFFTDQARQNERAAELLRAAELAGVSSGELSPQVFGTLSDTVSSQGVIAVLRMPRVTPPPAGGFVLVLDQIRDPGNLGTILRGAEAAGVSQVILTPGCVDPWNPKVIRSGMGAHFRLPLVAADSWAAVAGLAEGRSVWLADARGATPYDEVDWTGPCALVIGGEAAGLSAEAQQLGTGRVMIPMVGPVESLNAAMAATILVFEVARQRRQPRGLC